MEELEHIGYFCVCFIVVVVLFYFFFLGGGVTIIFDIHILHIHVQNAN